MRPDKSPIDIIYKSIKVNSLSTVIKEGQDEQNFWARLEGIFLDMSFFFAHTTWAWQNCSFFWPYTDWLIWAYRILTWFPVNHGDSMWAKSNAQKCSRRWAIYFAQFPENMSNSHNCVGWKREKYSFQCMKLQTLFGLSSHGVSFRIIDNFSTILIGWLFQKLIHEFFKSQNEITRLRENVKKKKNSEKTQRKSPEFLFNKVKILNIFSLNNLETCLRQNENVSKVQPLP